MAYKPPKVKTEKPVKPIERAKASVNRTMKESRYSPEEKAIRQSPSAGLKKSLNAAARSIIPTDPMEIKNRRLGMTPPSEGLGLAAPKRAEGHNGSFKFKVFGNRKGYKAGE